MAVLWRTRGTHTGAGNGLPATGKRFDTRGATVWRIESGRVKEEWSEFSLLALLRQVGLAPGGTPVSEEAAAAAARYAPARPGVSVEARERNRRLVESVFQQTLGEGRLSPFETLYAPGFVNHLIQGEGTLQADIESVSVRGLRQLAPDLRVKIAKTVAQGDLVALVYGIEGTNTGAALGLPATGKRFTARGISIMRVGDDGRIAEEWSVFDQEQALEQLGVLPAPPSSDPR